jgi:DNA polymerase-3 subunit gamma/tau
MSYLVLARKYRPQTFAEVVGQVPVVKTLQNSLLRDRIAHAILFSGVRGVGKTTLARIMAKAINCEAENHQKPCNTCSPCQQIIQGQSLDLHEIDGASNRGIQEIRELKERIRFLPTTSKYKIIIIDEVHMLTTEAFNALLKTLEEPPKHVYFMFATTELHKIPITILSRCQRYELKRVSAAELTSHFNAIAQAEKISIAPEALALIVREAEGSVRDGFSLLDQIFSFGDETISHSDVTQVLGLTDRNILLSITRALLDGDHKAAIQTLDGAFDYGIDLKRFTTDLLECFRTLLLVKIGDCQELIELPAEEITHLNDIAKDYSFETLHLKLSLLMQATEELRYTTQPRIALETAFFKIIEAGNVVPVSQLLGQLENLLKVAPSALEQHKTPELEAKKKLNPDVDKVPTTTEKVIDPPASETPVVDYQEPPLPTPDSSVDTFDYSQDVPPIEDTSQETPLEEIVVNEEVVDESSLAPHPHTTHDVRRDWDEFTEYVKERKVWMAKDLQRADSAKEKDGELHLHFSDPTTCTLLRNKENRRLLTEFVLDFFQKELRVRFILPDTIANGNDDTNGDNPQHQRQQLVHDPLVQMTVEIFNGQIGDIRIGPRSR